MNKRILITGASSALGKRIIPKLNKKFDLYLTGHNENIKLGIKGVNLLNPKSVLTLIDEIKPEIIIHLAAIVDLSRNFDIANKCIDINIKGTLNLLEAVRKQHVKKFIFTSTEEIYGNNSIPFTEEQIPCPPSPYSVSKIAGEQLCKQYANELNFSLAIFRLATFYGPQVKPPRLISQIILKALKNQDILLNLGKKKRDYLYIDDVYSAFDAVLNQSKQSINLFNLGGGAMFSLKEVVDIILNITKSSSKVIYGAFPDRIMESDEWLLNINKAKELLNWRPITSITEGISKTIKYFKSNPV